MAILIREWPFFLYICTTLKQRKMFIISLNYKVSMNEVEKYLAAHVEYLKEQYAINNFIASGRKVPRTGGIILSNIKNREELDTIINKDPFKQNRIADYDIIEFVPSMTSKELDFLI